MLLNTGADVSARANLTPANGLCGCHLVGKGGIDAATMDEVVGQYFSAPDMFD